MLVSGAPAIDKGKRVYIPTLKKKSTPPKKGIVVGVPIALLTLISEEEETTLRRDGIITPLVSVPVGEMSEED